MEYKINTYNNFFKRNRAFTLIEVLMASMISTILLLVLMTLLGTVADKWDKGVQVQDNFTEARSALRIIKEDLKSVYNTGTIGQASFPPLFIRNLPTGSLSQRQPPARLGDNISFFAVLPPEKMPDTSDIGDIAVIGYYVGLQSEADASGTGNSRKVHKLYRYIRGSSNNSITTLINDYNTGAITASDYGSPNSNSNSNYSLFTQLAGASQSAGASPSSDEPIAFNVIDLRFIAYELVGGALTETRTTGGSNNVWPGNAASRADVIGTNNRFLPHCVDIILKVVDDATAKKISSNWDSSSDDKIASDWSETGAYSELIKKKIKTFTTRVYFD